MIRLLILPVSNRTCRIEETKNGEYQTIHLSEQALEILARRFKSKINDWVFPSPNSTYRHIEEPGIGF